MTEEVVQIKLGGENYPKLLAHIPDPPKQLYYRGNLELLNSECVGVVGTRKLTPYGKESAQYITRGLAIAGFTIVSGLAMGIDAIAHQTTLDIGGKTIAVLGGGVSDVNIGPRINLSLARKILENDGLIISEYSDKEEIFATNFAARNRIISGLSKGVVIIEADRDSGSLITAKCALDQNRDVFAVPGNIFSQKSTGSNELIKSGAKLVMSARDIIEEYSIPMLPFGVPVPKLNRDALSDVSTGQRDEERFNAKATSARGRGELGQGDRERLNAMAISARGRQILAILEEKGEATADEIMSHLSAQTDLPDINTSDILSSLSMLEINGLIKQSSNGKYRIA